MARQGTIVETFRGIFRPFRCQKIPIAPYQHPTLAARLEKSGSTAPSPLPVRRFHIHSKTACRGFKSFCPCQKSQVSLLRCLTFSLVSRKIWQQGAPAGPTCGACRGGLQPCGLRPGPTEPAGETESGLNVIAFFADVLIRYHLSSPALIPSSTQNAPDFGCFRMKSGASLFFCWFSGAKFPPAFLCNLPHSAHKLKPSVMPCRREVSFLT